MSCKLSLGGKVILRRRTAAWEHRERHERRSWLRTLAFEAIVVCLAGFLEPSIHEELVAVLKDRERPSRLALGIVCSHFTLKRVVELSPATCLPVRPEP